MEPPKPPDTLPVPPSSLASVQPPAIAPIIESILFSADQPVPMSELKALLSESTQDDIQKAIESLRVRYSPPWGVHLVEVASGFQLRTSPEFREYVVASLQIKPQKLSKAALETLAIVAYKQPLTRPEIDEIRGVDSGGALKSLLDRKLLRILGRKEEPGRPVLYGTSKDFLEFFGLKDLQSLPTLTELRALHEEEQAAETGKPEEIPLSSLLNERKMGKVPEEIVENLDKAVKNVERLNETLPLPKEEPAPNPKKKE